MRRVEAASPAPKRITVGGVVDETFSIYGGNAFALLGAAIVVFVVIGVVSGLLQNAGGVVLGLLAGVIQLVGYALYTGFVVNLVRDTRDGRRDLTIGDLFSAAGRVRVGAALPRRAGGALLRPPGPARVRVRRRLQARARRGRHGARRRRH